MFLVIKKNRLLVYGFQFVFRFLSGCVFLLGSFPLQFNLVKREIGTILKVSMLIIVNYISKLKRRNKPEMNFAVY